MQLFIQLSSSNTLPDIQSHHNSHGHSYGYNWAI